ncbi:MAG: energy transducer TonB, partial [Phaeodactylibacter sp.]|nr:energy transducer TonB [Phaeodactylibacter sp.]
GQFHAIEGDIIFRNPQKPPHLAICKGEDESRSYDQCLLDAIYYNIKYPAEALAQKIEGLMIAELIIDEEGQVEKSTIVRSLGGGCDEEFIRLIESHLNQWKPAENDGMPVKSQKILAIKMALE